MMKPSVLAATAVMMAFAPGVVLGAPMETKGTTPYVTHFIFRPVESLDVPPLVQPLYWMPWGPRRT